MAEKPTYEEMEQRIKELENEAVKRKQAEEELRESEQRYRSLIENLPIGVFRNTPGPEGHFVMANPALAKMHGYDSVEEILQMDVSEVYRDPAERQNTSHKISTQGYIRDEELRLKKRDGTFFWGTATVNAVRDKFGEIAYFEGLIEDITKRKQAKKALQKNEDEMRAILDATAETIVLIDRQGMVITANQTVCERLGIKKEDFIGRCIYDFFPPEVAEKRRRKWELVFATGKPVSFEDNREGMFFEQNAYPVFSNGDRVEKVVSFARDITERKQAEGALKESEEKYRQLFELGSDALFLIEIQTGQILDTNNTALEMYGYSREEALQMKNSDFSSEPDKTRKATVESDSWIPVRYHRKKDGTVFPTEISVCYFTLHGKEVCVAAIRDITERKQAEKEKAKLEAQLQRAQKMEAIGTLAGGVAHDLNNVLSGIVSYPDLLLLDIPEDSPLRKPILTIQQSGQKAADIVQDLLTLARRGVAATEVTNLNQIINSYLKSPECENLKEFHPNVKIESDLETNLLNIMGSSVHLLKTVMNLVSNAAEAMPDGGNIFISTQSKYIDKPIRGYDDVKEGDYVVLTVSDTGIGISSEDMEKIFEPFYTKKVMGRSGTGLGMSVVWGTVKDHRGHIDVQSEEGKGTTFTLYFPVTRKQITGREEALPIEDYLGRGESVLVVDDVEEQREIASRILKKLGYSVATVSSGEEAVEYLKDNSADLLVLDMIMDPGIDGLETYKRILELHPGQKAIIASGFSETDRVKEAQRSGAGKYIKKPYTLEKIGLAVKEELEK